MSPLPVVSVLAALLLAGCGSDLPPVPTTPTWSTASTPATTSATATTAATTSPTIAAGAGAGADGDVPLARRTTLVALPRTTTTTRPAVRTTTTTPRRTATTSTQTTTTEKAAANVPYFRSCAQAKEAGAAPLHVGEPGYRPGLDGDHDGVACER
jgi:Excalibur calcium-binding domain